MNVSDPGDTSMNAVEQASVEFSNLLEEILRELKNT